MDFIEISIKSFIKPPYRCKSGQITKLGREIIEISTIFPVQAHKLLIRQGIYRNFDIFPQKCMLKTSRYSNLGHHCQKIVPISTKLKYFKSSKIHNPVGICNTGGITITVKHFLHKNILFYFCTSSKQFLHTTAQAQYLTKIQIQIFFSQTQLKQQHKARLFSLQLLTYCSTIGASFSHIFSHGDRAIHPIHSTGLAKQLV